MRIHYLLYVGFIILLDACVGVYVPPPTRTNTPSDTSSSGTPTIIAANFPESFDNASKSRYEGGIITTASGQWYLDNALMGSTDNDQKNGAKAIRIKESGVLRMEFDCPTGIQQVRLKYGSYQIDKESSFELWVSTTQGSSWKQIGSTLTANKNLQEASFNVNSLNPTRIEIRKTDGSANRLNIDDVVVITYSTSTGNTIPTPTGTVLPTKDDHLTLGNPSNASASTYSPDNYLMLKTAYVLSYNRSKGTANWVSWHLSTAWRGEVSRQDDFRPDDALPRNWTPVSPRDYVGSGFDRGHLCPSDDRTDDIEDNQETFLMTNMTPQAPEHNRGIWKTLEEYERTLLRQGNEVYVIAGPLGEGGTGSNGFARKVGQKENISVPASLWKIIVVLPLGQNDALRINENTRVIAVNIPNQDSVGADHWQQYRVSVDELERLTGFDFLSNVPVAIQAVIESRVDK